MAENFTPEPVPVEVPLEVAPKKDNKKVWIIVAVVVVVLCCCCVPVSAAVITLITNPDFFNQFGSILPLLI